MVMDSDLLRIFDPSGRPPTPAPAFAGPQEGRIVRVDDSGAYFTIPDWSTVRTFGPATWAQHTTVDVSGGAGEASFASHHHAVAAPNVGQRCLVFFVAGDLRRAWIVSWSD